MKKILLLLTIILISPLITAQDLPRYLTEEERELLKTYVPPVYERGLVTPPAQPVRTMAEWEELEGLLIVWTSYQSILRQIVMCKVESFTLLGLPTACKSWLMAACQHLKKR